MERFDPNGKTEHIYLPGILDDAMVEWVDMFYKAKYLPPTEICPQIKQDREAELNPMFKTKPELLEKGMCSIMSFIYVYMRLTLPTMNRHTILGIITNPKLNLHVITMKIAKKIGKLCQYSESFPTFSEFLPVLSREASKLAFEDYFL